MLLRMRAYRDVRIAQHIFDDGAAYYLVVLMGNMANLILGGARAISAKNKGVFLLDDLTAVGMPIAQTVASLMVARLQLDLRALLTAQPETSPPATHGLSFFSLGNLGEQVERETNWNEPWVQFDERSVED